MSIPAPLDAAPLVELRMVGGPVYLRPSRFARMRLQWTFRHFHILPWQLLSRRDRRLIEDLFHSAVSTPPSSPAAAAILGIIEIADLPMMEESASGGNVSLADQAGRWALLGVAAAVSIGLVVLLTSSLLFWHRAPGITVAHADTGKQPELFRPAIHEVLPVAPTGASPVAFRHLSVPGPVRSGGSHADLVAGLPSTPADLPGAQTARWVAELPQGDFARPIVNGSSPSGEVQLHARIAPDGSVSGVVMVSGNRALADAAMRAVRQWHYRPYVQGDVASEEQTRIRMDFFGPDAVSITSLSGRP